MRTNIVIDEGLMRAAMQAGAFTTKKDAVEAGLKLLTRQAAYREILKYRGKLNWDDSDTLPAAHPPTRTNVAKPIKKLSSAKKTTAKRGRK